MAAHFCLGFISLYFIIQFFAESHDAYRSWRGTHLQEEISSLIFSWVTAIFVLFIIELMFIKNKTYADPFIALWIVITPLELISWHALVRMTLGLFRSKGYNTRTVAIVGATPLGSRLETAFEQMDWSGFRFAGYYDDRIDERVANNTNGDSLKVKGDINQLIVDCKQGDIDTVYITFAMSGEERIKAITEKLADSTASVYLVPDLFTFNLLNSRWVDYQGITAISIYETPFAGIESIIKRVEDVVLSLLILTLIAIPMMLIALGIRLTSRGPILFKQTRYGIDGEKIQVWKFRSMTVSEDGDTVTQATKGDNRITPFGAFYEKLP